MSKKIHPAVSKACEIYDTKGDLAPYQQAFLTGVRKIRGECTASRASCCWKSQGSSKEMAIYLFGRESKTYLASAHLSDRQEACDLTKALAQYEEALEEA